jgi:membrane protein implicated in regulation of membrane protease activity
MDIGLEPWHVWTIVAVCLFIGEVFLPGFILASLAVGCLVAAATHQFTDELGWGIGGFAAGAGISLVLVRPYFSKALGPEENVRFGAEAMVGDVITVTDAGDVGGALKARYRDTVWSLQCGDELFEGDRVVIVGVQGGTLLVKRFQEE